MKTLLIRTLVHRLDSVYKLLVIRYSGLVVFERISFSSLAIKKPPGWVALMYGGEAGIRTLGGL